MRARLLAFREWAGDVFWVIPVLLSAAGMLLAEAMRWLEVPGHAGLPPDLVFAADAAGARALLGVVAGSAIGVAGTIFSITIAALSMTSGQMGPRLLRNFVRDSGNRWALGLFLMTFAYAVTLQRGVGAQAVPHLGLAVAVGLALLCTGTLAWFVHHVATGINVETVITLVHTELMQAAARLTHADPPGAPVLLALPPPRGAPVRCGGTGYLRAIDYGALADWAAAQDAVLVVMARPGDYLHPASRVAEVVPGTKRDEAEAALRAAMSLGPSPAAAQDLEFAVRQLVEVAVRALSPGVNDPFTAMAVLDRLGAVLAGLAGRHFPAPALLRDQRVVLYRRVTTHTGLCDAMFHMIREAGGREAAVLIRLLEVLEATLDVEADPARRTVLQRHARLALATGRRCIADEAGCEDLELRAASIAQA
ncbi:DUF2254 domain-containing protein [Roseomonas sp. HF4]|uniref:DUF2254 domain-containing protein n=1 Tax=Roseomonas sp. HF4 TaxID=2562313 RepID=UPI0010C0220D|nr:DUF2254 domain-containing protein [Roseomonas sp. HF4]